MKSQRPRTTAESAESGSCAVLPQPGPEIVGVGDVKAVKDYPVVEHARDDRSAQVQHDPQPSGPVIRPDLVFEDVAQRVSP